MYGKIMNVASCNDFYLLSFENNQGNPIARYTRSLTSRENSSVAARLVTIYMLKLIQKCGLACVKLTTYQLINV